MTTNHSITETSLMSRSLACIRLRIVMRRNQNRPPLVNPQKCVKPRKSNVSGFPRPRALRPPGDEPPELDQPSLVGMQVQPELREPLAKISPKSLRIFLILGGNRR